MKATIIGANGYIGKHLTMYLYDLNFDLFLYDLSHKFCFDGDFNYNSIDISNKQSIININVDVDYIFFMSGLTGTYKGFEDYENFILVNEISLLHVLDRLKNLNTKPIFIFPSTRLVYKGKKNIPLNEQSTKEFKTIYALNKWNGEQLLHQYSLYFGIKYIIFRIGVPYGNNFNNTYSFGTLGNFLNQVTKNNTIILYGDGSLKRTFTHIHDICFQIITILGNSRIKNETYNIAGETFSLKKIAQLISLKYKTKIKFTEWPENDLKIESGDTIFNSSKIRRELLYKSEYKLKKWIESLPNRL
jgi:UDP-glucose 4-epimerase